MSQPRNAHGNGGGVELPDHRRHRDPLPEQQDQREAREQDIGGAFDRFRHEPRPPLLELLARHHAVLNGEDRHQHKVDDERLRQGRGRSAVDALRHDEARDKADGVEKSREEDGVGCQSVEKRDESSHGILPVPSGSVG
jgi:hypothetical protein